MASRPPQAAAPSTNQRTTSNDKPGASSSSTRQTDDEELRPFVLAGELGKGSFATVYKGYHEVTHDQVAIKTVNRSNLTSKLFENLQSEIDILKSLSHRHITKLINIVRAEKNIYLIMEYCSGGDLTNYIKKRGKVESLEYIPSPGAAPQYYPHPKTGGLDEIVVRSFLRQLARALKFLRGRNLIHRDIKPQNLLLKPASPEELARGHPLGVPILKVADFGFARSLPNAMMAETLCGSPLYMAPEILRYEKYDAKADLWSVGAVLYETTVGRPPFRAQNHIELLKKIEHSKGVKFPDEDPANLEKDPELKPVPSDIKKLIRSLLKRFPAERASFEDFFSSTALAKSKFPRPTASPHSSTSTAANGLPTPSQEGHEQDAVIVGTMQSRLPALQESPFPESTRPAPPPPVTGALDANLITAPKINFRRRDNMSGNVTPSVVPRTATDNPQGGSPPFPPPSDPNQPERRKSNDASSRHMRPLSTEASIIPGESEEDGDLRREYVMVGDTRAIEFNKTVDEINAERRRPLRDRAPSSPMQEKTSDPAQEVSSPSPIPQGVTAFPPPPHSYAPVLSSSPSRGGALSRALSIASKKLFGAVTPNLSPRSKASYFAGRETSSSPRRPPLLLVRTGSEKDPLEEPLLKELEELAQKTDVLTRWADEIYDYVKAFPQKPLPRPSDFVKREGESDSSAERRKNADADAEYNAVTCVALYMLLMSFSQKGIDRLRVHQEGMKMRDPEGRLEVSEGFDEALGWFTEHFMKCSDRATLVKTWLPDNSTNGPMWLGQLVYDRALQISRKAAKMEIENQEAISPLVCEQLYEESLWLLYALQDDVMQSGNPFREEDKETISSWVTKTRKRLLSCRTKIATRETSEPAIEGAPARYPPPSNWD
ncbi:kinase-like protein [Schizopora paradoxa]|uniref:non-specific serine/threonine protein kinase n=1 Tax=Schizopora paradoxa TaxID=27342 RepID=A0A0H2R412_9AGAM|nr:kinase-like protein [Schizopora paradoxa]